MAQALSKDAAHRFGTCLEFVAALQSALNPVPAEPAAPVAQIAPVAREPEPAAPRARKPSTALIATAAAGLLLIGVIAFGLMHRGSPAQPRETAISPPPADLVAPVFRQVRAAAEQGRPPAAVSTQPAGEKRPARTWQVEVVTTPPDADVIFDNKPESACKSPCAAELAAGPHVVSAKKDTYRIAIRNFDVKADPPPVNIALEEVTGTLMLVSVPPGAAMTVNGKPRPEVTPAPLVLPVGKYKVKLAVAGYDPAEFDADIPADATREISVTLVKSQ
jgi:hypothetical protein